MTLENETMDVYDSDEELASLRVRIANYKTLFLRKAAEVLIDEKAMELLSDLREQLVIEIKDFDESKMGIALARLTAANFCEVGANVIFITDAGCNFYDAEMSMSVAE